MAWFYDLTAAQRFLFLLTAASVVCFLLFWLFRFATGYRFRREPGRYFQPSALLAAIALASPVALLCNLQGTHPSLQSLFVAFTASAAYAAVLFGNRAFYRITHKEPIRPDELKNQKAIVWVPIPKKGVGKVQLTFKGEYLELDAVSADGMPRPFGCEVMILSYNEELVFTVN